MKESMYEKQRQLLLCNLERDLWDVTDWSIVLKKQSNRLFAALAELGREVKKE